MKGITSFDWTPAGGSRAGDSGNRNPGKVPLFWERSFPGCFLFMNSVSGWLPGAHRGSVSLTGIIGSARGRFLRSGGRGGIHAAGGAGRRRRVFRTGRSGSGRRFRDFGRGWLRGRSGVEIGVMLGIIRGGRGLADLHVRVRVVDDVPQSVGKLSDPDSAVQVGSRGTQEDPEVILIRGRSDDVQAVVVSRFQDLFPQRSSEKCTCSADPSGGAQR